MWLIGNNMKTSCLVLVLWVFFGCADGFTNSPSTSGPGYFLIMKPYTQSVYPHLAHQSIQQHKASYRHQISLLSSPSLRSRSTSRQLTYDHYVTMARLTQSDVIDVMTSQFEFTDGVHFESFWMQNCIYVRAASDSFMRVMQQHAHIHSILPNNIVATILPLPTTPTPLPLFSRNEADGSMSWGVEKIRAKSAWNVTRGEGIRVAGIDTGVRFTHEALKSSYAGFDLATSTLDHNYAWFDPKEFKNDEWWCEPDLCLPEACCTDDPFDNIGHGTHTIGTIAGQFGVGVAPGVKWMAAKGCRDGMCLRYGLLTSAQWVMCPTAINGSLPRCDLGADVVSNSWGGQALDGFYSDVTRVWREAGMIPVFAAGNAGPQCESVIAPGNFLNVIGVGASDLEDAAAAYSSRGPGPFNATTSSHSHSKSFNQIRLSAENIASPYALQKPDVVAPGSKIISASNLNDFSYVSSSGTSMATPHVSGIIDLLLARALKIDALELTFDEVFNAITTTAVKLNLSPPIQLGGHPFIDFGPFRLPLWFSLKKTCGGVGWDRFPNMFYGYGRVDVQNLFSNYSGHQISS